MASELFKPTKYAMSHQCWPSLSWLLHTPCSYGDSTSWLLSFKLHVRLWPPQGRLRPCCWYCCRTLLLVLLSHPAAGTAVASCCWYCCRTLLPVPLSHPAAGTAVAPCCWYRCRTLLPTLVLLPPAPADIVSMPYIIHVIISAICLVIFTVLSSLFSVSSSVASPTCLSSLPWLHCGSVISLCNQLNQLATADKQQGGRGRGRRAGALGASYRRRGALGGPGARHRSCDARGSR